MLDKRAILKAFSQKYALATKKIKSKIIANFIDLTGYSWTYGTTLLRTGIKKIKKPKQIRKKKYDKSVQKALVQIWEFMDYICGQRLKPILPAIIEKMEQFNERNFTLEVKKKLCQISASTIDRILKAQRKQLGRRGSSATEPGNFLKKQIPIRTYGEWPEKEPGYLEIDLVSHEGGDNSGDYFWTLNATDVNSCWTVTELIRWKDQDTVLEGIKILENTLPFKILGIDCDNGSEFVNYKILEYCQERLITYTRCRPYKKNDNCYVEQKNYSVVRRNIGYLRYDTDEEFKIISKLYKLLNFYNNFFQPNKKIIERAKIGSKYVRKYDKPKTPYKRLIENPSAPQEVKECLKSLYISLNPMQLKKDINELQNRLIVITKGKQENVKSYLDKVDLYRLNRYRRRNKPAKNNPSIFVEKMSNRRVIESEEEKMSNQRKLIDKLEKSRKEIQNKTESGNKKKLFSYSTKRQAKKEDVIESLEAWIAGYEDAKMRLIKQGKYDEAKKKDKDIERIQKAIDKLQGKRKKKKQVKKQDESNEDKLERMRKCVGIVDNQRKKV